MCIRDRFNYNSEPGTEGDDLYIVPTYQTQTPDTDPVTSCNSLIAQCNNEETSNYPNISQGHVYQLGASDGVELNSPTANAGADQTVERGTPVALDGTNSTDDGTIESYRWTRNSIALATGSEPVLSSICLLYTSPSPRDRTRSRMPSSA